MYEGLTRQHRDQLLATNAAGYLATAMENIVREYPVAVILTAVGPQPIPTHRELHPAFFGCFDWHSCVELHWVIVRILRLHPDVDGAHEARLLLRDLLTDANLATELAFFQQPQHRGWERPYGWGWFLTLHHELTLWDDPDGRAWSTATAPLAEHLAAAFQTWLPKLTYPVRCGFHPNTAFALARALPYAKAHDGELTALIRERAITWFGTDTDYPAHYEPSGSDFLSAALTEAELMAALLPADEFAGWFDSFLPNIAASEPAALFQPAVVSDPSDGHIAHLHGLNLYRASAMCRIAEVLPPNDARIPVLQVAAHHHTKASLAMVSGTDYMVEHWLAAYAALLLGPDL
ncbi:MAG TPA: DUF2891 domain-containing protein [Thermomicrobiales bacterium]|nr:DUF2891 domain-containing protein [Thermomicrobiales bacterium]